MVRIYDKENVGDVAVDDWTVVITMALAAITAVATAVTATVDYPKRRTEVTQPDPIVGCRLMWERSGAALFAELRIRNQAACDIVVESIRVTTPGGAMLRRRHVPPNTDNPWLADMRERHSLNVAGIEGDRHITGDELYLAVAIQPPAGWRGGDVSMVLMISFNLSIARQSRITVKRSVTAPTAEQAAAPNSSQA